jgi:hypothetical protein
MLHKEIQVAQQAMVMQVISTAMQVQIGAAAVPGVQVLKEIEALILVAVTAALEDNMYSLHNKA